MHFFPPSIKEVDEEGDKESMSVGNGGGAMAVQGEGNIPEPIAGGMPPEQKNRHQAIDSPEWEERRKAEEVEMQGGST